MSAQTAVFKAHSNSYDIFILVLTIMSLAVMALLLLPLSAETLQLLRVYDNVICIVFLVDFFGNLAGARPRTPTSSAGAAGLTSLAPSPASGSSPSPACCACSASVVWHVSAGCSVARHVSG